MEQVIEAFSGAVILAVALSAIPLFVSLIVGLVVSVFQAATQIQEQTLTFIPKVAAVAAVLFFLGPWMLESFVEYTQTSLEALPELASGK